MCNRRTLKVIHFFYLRLFNDMAPWDSKMRWQFGGNLQPVRMICEFNWRECPLAIVNYIWSEIVTDVVECVTNEGMLLRIIILLLVCTILMHTIWSRAQWMTENIVNKDNLNRVGFKVQDLELRVNILTYKMQYGTWPSPYQIKGTNIERQKSNVRLTLSNSGNRNLWLPRYLEEPHWNPRHVSKSENLGLRFRKPKTLIETSRKMYYNRPSDIQRINDIPGHRRTYEKLTNTEDEWKKPDDPKKSEENALAIAIRESSKDDEGISSIIMSKHKENKEREATENDLNTRNTVHVIPKVVQEEVQLSSAGESYCEDFRNQAKMLSVTRSPNIDNPKNLNRVTSTQATLAQVKNRLEGLHVVLKTYESQHDSNLTEKDIVKKELAKAFLQELSELRTKTESDEKSTEITSNPVKFNTEDDRHLGEELISSDCEVSDQKERISDIESEKIGSPVVKKDEQGKFPIPSDTDEDLPPGSSISSRRETSTGSGSDKSSGTSDALMLTALLNQLGNSSRWNNKSDDDSECEPGNTFPNMKSFCQSNLLDIISEEQSGSSCNERTSKTLIHLKTSINSSLKIDESISSNNQSLEEFEQHRNTANDIDVCTRTEIKNGVGDIEKIFEPLERSKQNFNDLFDNYQNIQELSDKDSNKGSKTMSSSVKVIGAWDRLIEYSSEESIGIISPDIKNFYWEWEKKNKVPVLDQPQPENLFAAVKEQQLIDVPKLTLKRRPGMFSVSPELPKSPKDQALWIHSEDNDLIDLNDEEPDSKATRRYSEKHKENDLHIQISLMDIDGEMLPPSIEIERESVPLTNRTVVCSLITARKIDEDCKVGDDDPAESVQESFSTNSCKNSESKNLIELERIAYEELTHVENSWDSELTSKYSCEELSTVGPEPPEEDSKLESYNRKSPTNILSTASSLYLTVQGSLSDISMDGGHCSESIKMIEIPEEVKNIDKVENHVVKSNPMIVEPKSPRLNQSIDEKDIGDEVTVTSKDSALSETPQASIMTMNKSKSTDSRLIVSNISSKKLTDAETSSFNSSNETSSYVDANSHNFLYSSGISLSFDKPELSSSFDKVSTTDSNKSVHCSSASTLQNVPLSTVNRLSLNTSINSSQKIKKEKGFLKKEELKGLKSVKPNSKLSLGTRSHLNLHRENDNGRIPDRRSIDLPQRRSRSYVTPRKYESSPRHSLSSQGSAKSRQDTLKTFHNPDINSTNSKLTLLGRSNSNIKFDPTSALSRSCESVQKSPSKSCIPVLKTRFEGTRKDDCPPKSPQGRPLTMAVENISQETVAPEEGPCTLQDNEGNNQRKIRDEGKKKNPLIVPEGQTVIYVNIVTDSNNCVTKIVDPKKFLEYAKDKDLNIQGVVAEHSCKDSASGNNDCNSPRFLTVVSSASNSEGRISFYQQREMEILVKPSVMDTSTSISDFTKISKLKDCNDKIQILEVPKELTKEEYITLVNTLGQTTNLYEFQKIRALENNLKD